MLKQVSQSGMFGNSAANLSVDGNPGTCCIACTTCNEYTPFNTPAWVQIDLGDTYTILSLTLINSQDNYNRNYLQNFTVFVGTTNSTGPDAVGTLCYYYNSSNILDVNSFSCQSTTVGRYVTIKRIGGFRTDAISLCEVYIYGYKRIVGDIAINKPATQSGNYSDGYTVFDASRAVNGDFNNCAVSTRTDSLWWMVDLQNSVAISQLTIYNWKTTTVVPRYDGINYLANFAILVGDDGNNIRNQRLCYNNTGSVAVGGSGNSFTCTSILTGRYVSIQVWGGQSRLVLCEVVVYDATVLATTTTATTTTTTTTTTTMMTTTTTPMNAMTSFSPLSNNLTGNGTSPMPILSTTVPVPVYAVNSTSKSGLSTEALAGIIGAAGGVALLVIIALIIFFVCKKKNFSKTNETRKPSHLSRRHSDKQVIIEDSSSVYASAAPATYTNGRYISMSNLVSYVNELRQIPNEFQKEFKKLPDESAGVAEMGQLPENRLKNRYTNVLPFDHSIVRLEIEENDDEDASYINANFITGYKKIPRMYIAAQGPRPNTIDDFWRMIWQQRVSLIVMLTQLIEKTKNKCEEYWPTKIDEPRPYQQITVTLVSEEYYADYIDRQFQIHDGRRDGEMSRMIRHLQYLSWMDNGRPEHCFQLLSFRRKVKAFQMETFSPVVIHCSSGIGRTGAYIALDYLLDQLAEEGSVSVFVCVEQLRRQRMNMVQTQDQYEFVYDSLVEEIEIGDTSKSCEEFLRFYLGSKLNSSSTTRALERQFKQMKKISIQKPGRKSAGLESENIAKNRNTSMVAFDDNRTYLDVSYITRSDYINAVSVNSYQAAHAYILTQVPLKDTIVDFWRLIWDYELKTIVLLEDLTDSSPKYWSEASGSRTFGPFLVEMTSSQELSSNVVKRQFILSNTKDKQKESLTVNQFQLKRWLKKSTFRSEDVELLLELRRHLAHHQDHEIAPERFVMQCMDGSTKSGLFTAALHVIDRIISEIKVDVSLSCRYVRIHRPLAIDSMDHFFFLHEVACVCSKQLSSEEDGLGIQLKRLSLSTLYASVRSRAPNAST